MNNLIQWTKGAKYWNSAFNPVVGCVPVSEGCKNCYASEICKRFDMNGDGKFTPTIKPNAKPVKTGVVFVGNMTDIFGEWNSAEQIFDWINQLSSNAVNLILTKRYQRIFTFARELDHKHIFCGITAENQKNLVRRSSAFWDAYNSWLSLEPLLGEINLDMILKVGGFCKWVVVGAESGHNRRPCKIEWVESIVEQCQKYRVSVFVKQLDINGELVKNISKFPTHLQIRQVPWVN